MMMIQNMLLFTKKQKQLLMKVILIINLNQFILLLYFCLEKFSGWIIDSFIDHAISISKYKLFFSQQLCQITKKTKP